MDESRTTEQDPRRYQESWQRYWTSAQVDGEPPLWDSGLSDDYERDLQHFAPGVNSALPVLDLGCGNGAQTVRLAENFPHVIGADVSAAAIDLAVKRTTSTNVEYVVLDLLDQHQVTELHDRVGDVNVYMRGVLHQIVPEDRPAVARSLCILLGTHGVLFLVEPGQQSEQHMLAIRAAGPWPALDKVLNMGIQPGNVGAEEVLDLLGRDLYEVVDTGDSVQHTAQITPGGDRVLLPAYYLLVAPKDR